ncbi:MAG: molecular chaperone DnaK, partial [Frankiaceae bacterium]|nr:molecular chaperone DnaK [Frankiaceae bacterium]
EVTFDIDANGIVHVGATDKGTGKSQSMTITGGSALPKDEIDRMMREAEQFAEDDKRRREEVEVRNQAESLIYQTEQFLAENGDKVGEDAKNDVQEKLGALRAVVGGSDIEAIKSAVDELAKASSAMGTAMYANAQGDAGATGGPTGGAAGDPSGADDVVDAEIVDEDNK